MVLALVSITHSITALPTEFITAIEILSLCTSMPIYLVLLNVQRHLPLWYEGVPFLQGMRQALKTYSKGGALL
jgi:hypothetical protein